MVRRRLEVTVGVVGSGIAIDKLFEHPIRKIKEKTLDIVGQEVKFEERPVGGLQIISENIVNQFKVKNFITNQVLRLCSLEAIFSIIGVVILYLTNGSEKAKMPQELDCSQDPKAHEEKNKIVPDIQQVKDAAEASNDRHFTSKVARREIKEIEKRDIKPNSYINHKSQDVASIA
jgi:hypothetical protein